jgi:hypothetical protein
MPSEALLSCLAPSKAREENATSWQDFVTGTPRRLLLAQVLHSYHNTSKRIPVTVLTGLTPERLDQLKHQCMHWPGPLSAAVWVPVAPGTTAEQVLAQPVAQQLQELHTQCAPSYAYAHQRRAVILADRLCGPCHADWRL